MKIYAWGWVKSSCKPTHITDLIDAGTIRPVVDRILPFASTLEALYYVDAGRAKGKVVLTMSS